MKETPFRLERKRLADQIADQLMSLIVDGTFKPGDRLPSEPELMRQFQVGRSSIREAIGALSLIGLLSVRPGQGTHVVGFSAERPLKPVGLLGIGRDKINELVEARIELESTIARFAAERASEHDLAAIEEQHQLLQLALKNKETPIEADMAFHLAIAKSCHNSVLFRFFTEMRQPILLWMKQKAKYDWGYDHVYAQHMAIFEAITARKPGIAEDAVRSHLLSTGERLVSAMLADKKL